MEFKGTMADVSALAVVVKDGDPPLKKCFGPVAKTDRFDSSKIERESHSQEQRRQCRVAKLRNPHKPEARSER
jgi:hypothetical protein